MNIPHTPGPWIIADDSTTIKATHPLRKHQYTIVTVHYAFHHDEYKANALLIAAAPDMAEALRDLAFMVKEYAMTGGASGYKLDPIQLKSAVKAAYNALARAGL